MDKYAKKEMRRADKFRRFPHNTCPASRHAQIIGEALARDESYAMLTEEPEHCATTILSVVGSLYEARTLLAEVDAMVAVHAGKIDGNPRSTWPKGSVLERAIARHEKRRAHA